MSKSHFSQAEMGFYLYIYSPSKRMSPGCFCSPYMILVLQGIISSSKGSAF